MVFSCTVPGCKTGRKGYEASARGVTKHSFPLSNPELVEVWKKAIRRPPEWNPSTSTRICSLHFNADDYATKSTDQNTSRRKAKGDLKRKVLKPDAIPKVFVNETGETIDYYEELSIKSRLEEKEKNDNNEEESEDDESSFRNLKDLKHSVDFNYLPGYIELKERKSPHELIFMNRDFGSSIDSQMPVIHYCLGVSSNLNVTMWYKGEKIKYPLYAKLLNFKTKLQTETQLYELLNFLEAYEPEETREAKLNLHDKSRKILEDLDDYLSHIKDDAQRRKIIFIGEQLSNSFGPPAGYRYSTRTVEFCARFYNINSDLYKEIYYQDLLCLPSIGHIDRYLRTLEKDQINMIMKTEDYVEHSKNKHKRGYAPRPRLSNMAEQASEEMEISEWANRLQLKIKPRVREKSPVNWSNSGTSTPYPDKTEAHLDPNHINTDEHVFRNEFLPGQHQIQHMSAQNQDQNHQHHQLGQIEMQPSHLSQLTAMNDIEMSVEHSDSENETMQSSENIGQNNLVQLNLIDNNTHNTHHTHGYV